jgi:adenylate kinase family enzyme
MTSERIVIVGKSGAGKSTLAAELARKFDLQNIELDSLSWQANWTQVSKSEMREKADLALHPAGHWVADGNYVRMIQDIAWLRADTLIWLDYPLCLTFWRLFKRTIKRIWTGEELWNGNRESLWKHLTAWNPDNNLFAWCWRMHWNHRRDFPVWLEQEEHRHLKVLIFRHPNETDEWLRGL